MALIELKHVSFTYPGSRVQALEDISLTIHEGEYIALVGRNGSGKSTLVRLFNGLRKASSGAVSVLGMDAANPANMLRIRSAVTLVFQSPQDQIVSSCVEKDVAFGPENLGLTREEVAARVNDALHAVGIENLKDRQTRFLSGGQLQKVALAGAIAMKPRCIIFDEATSMLDPAARENLLQQMNILHKAGTTIIHVTHDMEEAAKAERIILIEKGRLCFDGSPAAFFGYASSCGDGGLTLSSSLQGLGSCNTAIAVSEQYGLGLPSHLLIIRALGIPPEPGISVAELSKRISNWIKRNGSTLFLSSHMLRENGLQLTNRDRGSEHVINDTSQTPAVVMEQVSYSYHSNSFFRQEALKNVTMMIKAGMRIALIGKAGSGKSTCLQLMNAILLPSRGRVLVNGIDTGTDAAARRLRTSVPLAIQRPETALFETYAGDDVAFGPRNLGLSGTELVTRVRKWMDASGLPYSEFRDRPIRSLSGGEKRRLALAGIFAMESDIILLDEPSAALDPDSKKQIWAIVEKTSEKNGTIIFATHSPEEAAYADRVAVFENGRLLAFGEPNDIFGPDYKESWGVRRPILYELNELLVRDGLQREEASAIIQFLKDAFLMDKCGDLNRPECARRDSLSAPFNKNSDSSVPLETVHATAMNEKRITRDEGY